MNKRSVEAKQIVKLINRSYLQLSFHALEIIELDPSKTPRDNDPKIVFNRYPIFLLDIASPPSEYDITFDPTKSVIEFKVQPPPKKKVNREHHRYNSLLQNWSELLKAVALALKDSWVVEIQPPAPNEDQKDSISSSVSSLPVDGLDGTFAPSSASLLRLAVIQPSENANSELGKENSSPKQRITRYSSAIAKQVRQL